MFYRSFGTRLAIRKTIKFTLESQENAFQIGQELCFIYTTLAKYLHANDTFQLIYCYNYLSKIPGWEDTFISSVFTNYVDPTRYFSMVSIKLLSTNRKGIIQAFFRGYYLGYLITYNIPNSLYNTNEKWIVFYDCHYHYLLFLYNQIRSWQIVNTIEIKLNDNTDIYSMNEENDIMSYKLIIKKDDRDLIDPIYILLDWMYSGCSIEQTYSDDDRKMHCIMNVIKS